ncbi:hypothetical protein JVU11DRAFT_8446 [Chiua virens]|nr:hypothetical protein JVU11DRAFT_8446 [Chiua virens]
MPGSRSSSSAMSSVSLTISNSKRSGPLPSCRSPSSVLRNSWIPLIRYKHQAGWTDVLDRFRRANGTLYDLEFLTDASGRRVAAFGFHAGFAGAAAGALALAAARNGKPLGRLELYANEQAMVSHVKETLGRSGKGVRALVIGALGRCGRGAIDLLRKIGLDECVLPFTLDDILKWDLADTAKSRPFQEILDVDIFANCIYLSSSIPPFLTVPVELA